MLNVGQMLPAPMDSYEAIFTALAHPARRRILISVNFAGGEMTAGEIAGLFAHAWPTTTRHLQVLEAADLLEHERVGRTRVYRLNPRPLLLARDWLTWFGIDPVSARESENVRDKPRGGSEAVSAEHRGG